jgi:LAS superfamily LD-carboxypeptidase LdcB
MLFLWGLWPVWLSVTIVSLSCRSTPLVRFVRIPKLSLRAVVTTLSVVLALAFVSAPIVSSAQRQAGGDPSAERERVRAQKAEVASQVDALQATDAQVSAALDALEAHVAGQQALLAEAQRAAEQAEQAFADATAAVDAKTREIAGLRDDIREFAVDAFVHPPSDDALAALDSEDPGEAAEKRALLEVQNSSDADLLDRLRAAEEDLEVQRQLAEDASRRAEEKQAAASNRLAELTEARDQQAAYAAQVEARLEHTLSEAAALQELDEDLSAQIAADQARALELARRAAASAPRPPSGGGGGGGGSLNPSLGSASCPSGGSITVASSIVGRLQSLLNAAASSGVNLCGGGYRSAAGQIETRRNNCGTSDYAIYEMPASQCSPPTARPGQSMHERGLAIDFTCNGGGAIGSHSSPCFQWLAGNASSYGFYNLPSEPWHWSTNGN